MLAVVVAVPITQAVPHLEEVAEVVSDQTVMLLLEMVLPILVVAVAAVD